MNDLDKQKFRKHIREQLQLLDKLTFENLSYKIAQRLFLTEEWQQAKVIGVTVSIFPEVDTWQIIRMAWNQGKEIAVPRCVQINKDMKFRRIENFSDLEQTSSGLYEPKEDKTLHVRKEHIDLLIVPGVGFDRFGYRIGFGGGYYDRFLVGYLGKTLSLAFSRQIFDFIPTEHFDIPVQKIITDKTIIHCQK